jgi:serine/threonine protein kinase
VENALTPGARIGSYEVIDRLGAGGMGEVYRARDTRLGRTVALKVLRPDADPELLHRLDREARAASGLNHPNIVQIYDVGESAGHAGAHYVVMEHVEGETLRRRLARGRLSMAEVLDLGAQLADGLATAHRAGIVHRDLKPENLMVTPDGRMKILDFGLAKVLVAPLRDVDAGVTMSRHGTQAGMLVGTLEYMSPEQASGRTVDQRTDQFSLGLILYEMAGGSPAFRRDSPAQVLAAVIERDPEPLGRLRPDVPAALETLVARCLQKDPERRFAETTELASQLSALAGHSRSGSRAEPAEVLRPSSSPLSPEVLLAGFYPPRPPSPPPSSIPALYHVQSKRRVHSYDEVKLAQLIRRGKLTGLELVRKDEEEQWQPLYESRVFRRETPSPGGDPRAAARWHLLRGVGGHFTGFIFVSIVMYSTQGHFPFWLGIWGAVLGMQALSAAPAAWALWSNARQPAVGAAPAPEAPALPAREMPRLAAPAGGAAPPSAIAGEAARVRVLIEQRGGSDAARLLDEVDKILKLTAELAAQEADIEEQTSDREREGLAAAAKQARANLERADLAQDRRLFERQLEVVQGREETIEKAVRVLARLRVRRELAEHQLKQLRLDLSRSAASGLDVPELSSRLQFIRYEVDAREEVKEISAGRG